MLTLVSLVISLAALQEPDQTPAPPATDDEIKKAFTWFDTLGFPDLTKAKFVRVATGWGDDPAEGKPAKNHFTQGFLVSEHGDEFTIFFPTLHSTEFKKTGPGTPEHKRVGWEKADVAEYVRAQIDELVAIAKAEDDHKNRWRRFGERLAEPAELFVLARGAAAVGQEKHAFELYRFAATQDADRLEAGTTFVDFVSDRIAHSEMWRTVLDFGNPGVSRSALSTAFRRIVKLFAKSDYAERAKETADLLDQMVREDEEHAKKMKKDFKAMTPEEKAEELVFRLRDQNGEQWSQPGRVDFFNDSRGEESPASQLVALGYIPVARLIEALDDRRFTRSVQYHRDFYFSHYALRVADAAQAVLEKITARDFDPPHDRDASEEERRAETKKLAQKWWAEFQKKGEKQMLIEGTERAEVGQARRLVEKFPAEALAPLRKGIEAAEGSWERERLIDEVGKLKGGEATELLRTLMKNAGLLDMRVAAASALFGRKSPDAVPAMIAEWEKLEMPARRKQGDPRSFFGNPADDVIKFLAGSGHVEALKALGRNLSKRPPGQRYSVISSLGEKQGNFSFAGTDGSGPITPGDEKKEEPSKELTAAMEDVLVAALQDTAEREGMSGTWGGKSYSDPRICDIAGHILWMRWPAKFPYDLEAPLKARDRQLVILQNTWRKERGLPEVAIPEVRAAKPLAVAEVEPLITRLLKAPTGSERRNVATEIMKKGSVALPAFLEIAGRYPEGSDSRKILDPLSFELACRVEDLVFVPGDLEADALKKTIDGFRGRTLDAESMIDLVIQACRKLPKGAAGIRIVADRDGDLTGVRLRINLVPEGEGSGLNPGAWDRRYHVNAGGESLGGSSGTCSRDYGLTAECHKDFRKAAEEALATPPATPFLIRIVQYLDQ